MSAARDGDRSSEPAPPIAARPRRERYVRATACAAQGRRRRCSPRCVEAIDAARDEVLLETYIFDFDDASVRASPRRSAAAARGVTVRVVVDGIGTGDIPDEWRKRWQAAGVQWRVFNPARGWRLLLPARWRRLHRKLLRRRRRRSLLRRHQPASTTTIDPNLRRARAAALRLRGATRPARWSRTRTNDDAAVAAHAGRARGAPRSTSRRRSRPCAKAARAGSDADDAEMRGRTWPRPGATARHPRRLVLRDNLRFRRTIEHFYRYAIGQREERDRHRQCLLPARRRAAARAAARCARRGVHVTLLLQGRVRVLHAVPREPRDVRRDAGRRHRRSSNTRAASCTRRSRWSTSPQGRFDRRLVEPRPLSLLLAREANLFIRDDALRRRACARHLQRRDRTAARPARREGRLRRPRRIAARA